MWLSRVKAALKHLTHSETEPGKPFKYATWFDRFTSNHNILPSKRPFFFFFKMSREKLVLLRVLPILEFA